MDNQENLFMNPSMGQTSMKESDSSDFGTAIGAALAYFFSMLAYMLFLYPYAVWKGATYRLYKECRNKSLKRFALESRWPFFSFCKKIFFGFFIDGMMFISYFVGALVSLIVMFAGGDGSFLMGLLLLVGTYYSVIGLSIIRDFCVLALLPFQKFISWLSKPAQQIDVDFHNR